MDQYNHQSNHYHPYYQMNNNSSSLPPLPYQRSVSSNDLYKSDIYGPLNNNYIHNIYEERYSPYSRYIPKRYEIERPIHSHKKRFDKYDRCNYYYNNSNNSLRKSPYYNFTEAKQGQFSYTPIEKGTINQEELSYRNIPIYQQKAVNFDIKPLNNSINYGPNNRMYSANERYDGNNYYYNDGNRSMNCQCKCKCLSPSLPMITRKKYYDGYSPEMKSEYKDNYIWSRTYK